MTRIDPNQLLSTMSVLLAPDGGIRSIDEVPRIVQLMHKFSKKLVSKCIYIHILRSSSPELLELFLSKNGWELLNTWFLDAYTNGNLYLCGDLVRLFALCPMTGQRLRTAPERNPAPRILNQLSTDSRIEAEVRNLAMQVVQQWIRIARKKPLDSDYSDDVELNSAEEDHVQDYDADQSEDYVPPTKTKKVEKKEKKVVSPVKKGRKGGTTGPGGGGGGQAKKVENGAANKKNTGMVSGHDSVDDLLDGTDTEETSDGEDSSDEELAQRQKKIAARSAPRSTAVGDSKKRIMDLTAVKTSPSSAQARAKFEEREKEIRRRREAAAAKEKRMEKAKPYSRTELRKELEDGEKDKIKRIAQQLKEQNKNNKPMAKLGRIPKLPKKEPEIKEAKESFGSMLGALDTKPKPKVMPGKNKNRDLLETLAGTTKEKLKSKAEIEKEQKEKEKKISEQMKEDAKIQEKIIKEEEEKIKEEEEAKKKEEEEAKIKEEEDRKAEEEAKIKEEEEKKVKDESKEKEEVRSKKDKERKHRIRRISSSSSSSSDTDEEKKEKRRKEKEREERRRKEKEEDRRRHKHKEERRRRDKEKERRGSTDKDKDKDRKDKKESSKKDEVKKEDAKKDDSKKDDAKRDDSKNDDAKREDSKKDDVKKESRGEKRPSTEEKQPPKKPKMIKESNMFGDLLSHIMKEDKQKTKKRRPSENKAEREKELKLREYERQKAEKAKEAEERLGTASEDDKTTEAGSSNGKVEARLSPVREEKEADQFDKTKPKKGILCYGRLVKRKRNIVWATDQDLVQVEYFELDEDERTNVFKQKLNFEERRKQELLFEKNKFKSRNDVEGPSGSEEKAWKLTVLDLKHPVEYGCDSKEKEVQREREKRVLSQLYFNNAVPPDPSEPDQAPSTTPGHTPKPIPQIDTQATTENETLQDYSSYGWSSRPAPSQSSSTSAAEQPPPSAADHHSQQQPTQHQHKPASAKSTGNVNAELQNLLSSLKPGLLENLVSGIASSLPNAAAGGGDTAADVGGGNSNGDGGAGHKAAASPTFSRESGGKPKFNLPPPVSSSQNHNHHNKKYNGQQRDFNSQQQHNSQNHYNSQHHHGGGRGGHKRVCKFFSQYGSCKKGDSCIFAHVPS